MKKIWSHYFCGGHGFCTAMHAEAAKRLGGGKSMGQQSNNVTQREAAKPAATLLQNRMRTAACRTPLLPAQPCCST